MSGKFYADSHGCTVHGSSGAALEYLDRCHTNVKLFYRVTLRSEIYPQGSTRSTMSTGFDGSIHF